MITVAHILLKCITVGVNEFAPELILKCWFWWKLIAFESVLSVRPRCVICSHLWHLLHGPCPSDKTTLELLIVLLLFSLIHHQLEKRSSMSQFSCVFLSQQFNLAVNFEEDQWCLFFPSFLVCASMWSCGDILILNLCPAGNEKKLLPITCQSDLMPACLFFVLLEMKKKLHLITWSHKISKQENLETSSLAFFENRWSLSCLMTSHLQKVVVLPKITPGICLCACETPHLKSVVQQFRNVNEEGTKWGCGSPSFMCSLPGFNIPTRTMKKMMHHLD